MVEEATLVHRARNGDPDAFRELVERSMKFVYRLAYDLTGNRQDAEDLSQEVFLKAHRSLPSFRGTSKWTTWLYRITVNAGIDARKMKKHIVTEYDDDSMAGGSGQSRPNAPDRIADAAMIQAKIEHALSGLSPNERSVFVLRHYHDLPLRQIAEILDVAEGTVKSHLFRAVQRLQKDLAMFRKEYGLEEA